MKKIFVIFFAFIIIFLGVYIIRSKNVNNYFNRFELGANAFLAAFNDKPNLNNDKLDDTQIDDNPEESYESLEVYENADVPQEYDDTWDMFEGSDEIDITPVYSGGTTGYAMKYIKNTIAAHDSFNGNIVEISGTVTRTYLTPDGQGIVVLDEVIHAVIASEAREEFAQVSFMDSIRLHCVGAPMSNDLIIVDLCTMIETPNEP